MKNHIQKILKERNMRAARLAELLDVAPSQVTRLIKGERRLTHEWIIRICKALDVTAEDIVSLPKEMKASAKCDPVLMQSILMWVLDACQKYKIKPTSKFVSKCVASVYNRAAGSRLNFKQTRDLAFNEVQKG